MICSLQVAGAPAAIKVYRNRSKHSADWSRVDDAPGSNSDGDFALSTFLLLTGLSIQIAVHIHALVDCLDRFLRLLGNPS